MSEYKSPQDMPVMICGCRAMATDGEGNPACAIHGVKEVDKDQPDLTGRRARCSHYGRTVDRHAHDCILNNCRTGKPCQCELASDGSEGILPFFVYRGHGSYQAVSRCKHCNYYYKAHKKKEEEFMPSKGSSKVCNNFESHGPFEYDEFYCGCGVGWD